MAQLAILQGRTASLVRGRMSAPTSDAAIDVAIADEIEVAGYGTPDPPPLDHHPAAATSTTRGHTEDRQESPSITQRQQSEHDSRQQGSQEPQGHQAEDGARDGIDGHGSGPENDETRGHGMWMIPFLFYFISLFLVVIRPGVDDTCIFWSPSGRVVLRSPCFFYTIHLIFARPNTSEELPALGTPQTAMLPQERPLFESSGSSCWMIRGGVRVLLLLLPSTVRYQTIISCLLLQTCLSSLSSHWRLPAARGCQDSILASEKSCLPFIKPFRNAVEKASQVCRLFVECFTATHNSGNQSSGIMVAVLAPV